MSISNGLQSLVDKWQEAHHLHLSRASSCFVILTCLCLFFEWNYRDLCWALWTHLVWIGFSLLVLQIFQEMTQVRSHLQRVRSIIQVGSGMIALSIAIGVIGALFSFFAQHEPAEILGVNGFVNRGPLTVLDYTSQKYSGIFLLILADLYFAFRLSQLKRSPISQLPGKFGVMIGGLLIGFITSLGAMYIGGKYGAEIFLLIFWLVWFSFPWRVFAKDSIQDLIYEKRPQFYVGIQAPFKVVNRPSPAMIAIVWVLASYFALFGIGMVGVTILGSQRATASVGSTAAMLIIALFLAGATLFLFTLAIAVSKSKKTIHFDGLAFHIVVVQWKKFKEGFLKSENKHDLTEFKGISYHKEYQRSDSGSYTEYTLILEHAQNPEHNIELYRAYDEEHITTFAHHYSDLFKAKIL